MAQVIYSEAPTEFQRCYEVLLSKRLLRGRHHSLDTERQVLSSLPPMERAIKMLNDVDLSLAQMERFRAFEFRRVNPPSLLFSETGLAISFVAASLWSTSHINPASYATLRLPKSLQRIQSDYERFFEIEELNRQMQQQNAAVTYLRPKVAQPPAAPAKRQLRWCHGGGSVIASTRTRFGKQVCMQMSEPQYALVDAIDCISKSHFGRRDNITVATVMQAIGLPWHEMQDVLNSLLQPAQAIVRLLPAASNLSHIILFSAVTYSECQYDILEINEEFLDSLRECVDDDADAVFTFSTVSFSTLQQREEEASSSSVTATEWRNEVVDASIVRCLKQAAKFDSSSSSNGSKGLSKSGAVALDSLTEMIKAALGSMVRVSDVDVIRRTEHLVSRGLITKSRGDATSFRSVFYSYLPTIDKGATAAATAPTTAVATTGAAATTPSKLRFGSELFEDLVAFLQPTMATTDVSTRRPSPVWRISKQDFFSMYTSTLIRSTSIDVSQVSVPVNAGAFTLAHNLNKLPLPAEQLSIFLAVIGRLFSSVQKQLQTVAYLHRYGREVADDEWKQPAFPSISDLDPHGTMNQLTEWLARIESRKQDGEDETSIVLSVFEALPDGLLLAAINRFERLVGMELTEGLFEDADELHAKPFQYVEKRSSTIRKRVLDLLDSDRVAVDLKHIEQVFSSETMCVPAEFQLLSWAPYVYVARDGSVTAEDNHVWPLWESSQEERQVGTISTKAKLFVSHIDQNEQGCWGRVGPLQENAHVDIQFIDGLSREEGKTTELWMKLKSTDALGVSTVCWQPWTPPVPVAQSRGCCSLLPATVTEASWLFENPAKAAAAAPAGSAPSFLSTPFSATSAFGKPISESAGKSEPSSKQLYCAKVKVAASGHRVRKTASFFSEQVQTHCGCWQFSMY